MNVPRIKLTHKNTIIIAIAIVVLIVVALAAWMLWASQGKDTTSPISQPSLDEVLSTGMGYSDKGDIDAGLAYYDEQIEQREDKSEKQQVLLYKSGFALQAQRPDVAVESAKQADNIESNPASLKALARAYDSKGDKEQAILYYKKLIEVSPKDGMGSRYNQEWQRRIEELES